jgi:hypothetical protein
MGRLLSMDDTQNTEPERPSTIVILGRDYPASPFGPEQLVAIPLLKQVSTSTAVKLIFKLFLVTLGQEAHDDISLALAGGDIDFAGLVKIVSDLADVTAKAKDVANTNAGK